MMTAAQLAWLQSESKRTGLNQTEIMRRAVDSYADAQSEKRQEDILTSEQRRQIRQLALDNNISEEQAIRALIDKELRHRARLKRS